MAASYDGHVEVLDKLLQHGARVDIQNVVLLLRYSATILLCVSQSTIFVIVSCLFVSTSLVMGAAHTMF